MLGCGGPAKPAPTTPQNTAPTTQPAPAADPATVPTTATNNNESAPTTKPTDGKDPCEGVIIPPQTAQPNPEPVDEPQPATTGKKRPRGGGDRPVGRGFVLA